MNVLIIEDERKAALELQSLVLQIRPQWEIAAIIPSAADAIEWFHTVEKDNMPGLIFTDIQLADAVCFDIFEKIRISCPVIFCTAYDEYAIKSFETNSIDYLLKPVDKQKLERALAKLDNLKNLFATQHTMNLYPDLGKLIRELLPAQNKSILIHQKEKIIPVLYADIAYFHYDEGIITIKLINGLSYHVSQGIDEIGSAADAGLFYRANRQFLINRHAIHSVEKFFARKLVIKMKTDTPEILVVSKARAGDFLTWLRG